MKIFLIDNYDSFTYNLVETLAKVGEVEVTVKRNDQFELSEIADYDKLLLSPGPGIPDEAGLLKAAIETYAEKMPILGVCLGHQAIAEVFGSQIVNLPKVYHGISSEIELNENDYLFQGIGKSMTVGRYHSWAVTPESIKAPLSVIATDHDKVVHALKHNSLDIRGVQFHPESVMTEKGLQLLTNWVNH